MKFVTTAVCFLCLYLTALIVNSSELGTGGGSDYSSTLDTHNSPETSGSKAYYYKYNDLADAIVAVENELGLSPRGGYASVRARLDGVALSTPTLSAVQVSTNNIYSCSTSGAITKQPTYFFVTGSTSTNSGGINVAPSGVTQVISAFANDASASNITAGVTIFTSSFQVRMNTGSDTKFNWLAIVR